MSWLQTVTVGDSALVHLAPGTLLDGERWNWVWTRCGLAFCVSRRFAEEPRATLAEGPVTCLACLADV